MGVGAGVPEDLARCFSGSDKRCHFRGGRGGSSRDDLGLSGEFRKCVGIEDDATSPTSLAAEGRLQSEHEAVGLRPSKYLWKAVAGEEVAAVGDIVIWGSESGTTLGGNCHESSSAFSADDF